MSSPKLPPISWPMRELLGGKGKVRQLIRLRLRTLSAYSHLLTLVEALEGGVDAIIASPRLTGWASDSSIDRRASWPK